ncbi:uncharacterized protein LOC132547157 [Ylistrum balloti]|uniref:uncharacterized protein LOC132547157 n=1 Tax=Ylistrum balloti TaxID=509963 RepID=UPI0029058ED1|nr:uncharacterized protein LOC132547157 [Ylistrum balloti]
MDGYGDLYTDGHGYMSVDTHSSLYLNVSSEADVYADSVYGPGDETYTDQSKSYSNHFRKRILGTDASSKEDYTKYDRPVISTPGSGDGRSLNASPDNNFWSALLRTSQINIQRRDINNNTKKHVRKRVKDRTKIIIPCGEQLQNYTSKPKFNYELPPLKGVPSCDRGAQRCNLKVNEIMVGTYCSNISTPKENLNLESRLTYLDKVEHRSGFRSSAKKTKQNNTSVKLPKLIQNDKKCEDYDQESEKSLFKLPSIVGTTCLLDAATQQCSPDTIHPEVSEDSGAASCSLGNVKLPAIFQNPTKENEMKWKNKFRG